MTNYMSQGTKAVIKPPILTIVGFPGAGKTSLAGLFPSPAFIMAEDARTVFQDTPEDLQPHFNPLLPKANKKKGISTKQVLLDQLREFATEDHPFKTLVFDTCTVLNDLFEHELVEYYPGKTDSITDAAGGFQKAFDIAASWHEEIITACYAIRDRKNMAIVFLAHSDDKKIKNHAELTGDYTVYGMRMNKKSEDVYKVYSNAVVYLKQLESTRGHVTDDKGRTIKRGKMKMSEDRVLITSSGGMEGFVSAKTQYEMPQEINVQKGTNPILQYIPFYRDYVSQNGLLVPQEQEDEIIEGEVNE